MIQRYVVTIDVDAVQTRLRLADHKPASRAQALIFLKALGFAETKWPGVFVGSADAVSHLESGEVVNVKPFGEHG